MKGSFMSDENINEQNEGVEVEAAAPEAVEPEAAAEEQAAEAVAEEPAAEPEPAPVVKKAEKAEKADKVDKPAKAAKPAKSNKQAVQVKTGVAVPVFAVCVVIAVVLGFVFGHFVLSSDSTVSLSGKTSLTDTDLDSTIATYSYNGQTTSVTAREVILSNSTLDAAKSDDDTYEVPTADDVISYARNQIVIKAAEAKGITVSDDDVDEYCTTMFGSSDYASIASQYSIDEDTAKATIKQSCIMSKLRDAVATTEVPDQPTSPTEPADDATDTPTAEYAAYIIDLAGDEWDSENNTWASTDGDYYAALSTYEITNDSATYAAAEAAYNVAYSAYSTAYSQKYSEWSTYVNEVLSNATIQIGSLAV